MVGGYVELSSVSKVELKLPSKTEPLQASGG